MSLAHAFKWSFLAEWAAKLVQPLVFIVLARLLTPEDFGVMTAALMIVAFSQIFWEAGMNKALIQRQTDIETAANAAFRINVVLGILIALMLFAASPLIAKAFFQDYRVAAVLQVMTLHILLAAVCSVHIALLQKAMEFKKLFWVRLTTVGLPGLAAIPLAWYGMGFWALVVGAVIGQLVQAFMLWRISSWTPTRSFDFRVARDMGRFGFWVGLSALLAWFYTWADSLIVGMFLGVRELGEYRVAMLIVNSVVAVFASPVSPVAYSKFSMEQENRRAITRGALLGERALSLILFPLVVVLVIWGSELAGMLLGAAWKYTGELAAVLMLSAALAHTVALRQVCYRAINKPQIETKIMTISMLIRLPVYLVSIQFGLWVFVVARVFAVMLGVLNHLFFSRRYLDIAYADYFRNLASILILTGLTLSAWLLVNSGMFQLSYTGTLMAGILLMAVYLGALLWREASFLRSMKRAIMQSLS